MDLSQTTTEKIASIELNIQHHEIALDNFLSQKQMSAAEYRKFATLIQENKCAFKNIVNTLETTSATSESSSFSVGSLGDILIRKNHLSPESLYNFHKKRSLIIENYANLLAKIEVEATQKRRSKLSILPSFFRENLGKQLMIVIDLKYQKLTTISVTLQQKIGPLFHLSQNPIAAQKVFGAISKLWFHHDRIFSFIHKSKEAHTDESKPTCSRNSKAQRTVKRTSIDNCKPV